jgi:dolichol-phosphate mannosyltransferase
METATTDGLAAAAAQPVALRLSVVIPARNESGRIEQTIRDLELELAAAAIEHQIVVIDDHSTDRSVELLESLTAEIRTLLVLRNERPPGFGHAVVTGIEASDGDALAVFMADGSDLPGDLVRFVRTMEERDVDCVFGTRFGRGGRAIDYPLPKLVLNRFANNVIRVLFRIRYNDVTNAFKLYRRHVIDGARPFLSHHFNLTVELPLKAIIRGYSYVVLPNTWVNRREGISKFQVKEMGSRYVFIVLYCLLESWLSRGDYRRRA